MRNRNKFSDNSIIENEKFFKFKTILMNSHCLCWRNEKILSNEKFLSNKKFLSIKFIFFVRIIRKKCALLKTLKQRNFYE